jgi:hypothetical protein
MSMKFYDSYYGDLGKQLDIQLDDKTSLKELK